MSNKALQRRPRSESVIIPCGPFAAPLNAGVRPQRVRMRRLKTKHSYHDAEVRAVEFEASDSVVFEVELCGCSGSPGTTVHLSFHGVKNMSEVRSFIDSILKRAKEREQVAEIIGLARDDNQRFLIDMDEGALYIRAKSFTET